MIAAQKRASVHDHHGLETSELASRSQGRRNQVRSEPMGLNLVIVSDTHLPLRARSLPDQLWSALEAADVVVHAGDWVSEAALDEFEARCRRLIAVYGNNDGPPLRARLPEIARVELAGLRIAVVHETGPAKNREVRCAAAFPD